LSAEAYLRARSICTHPTLAQLIEDDLASICGYVEVIDRESGIQIGQLPLVACPQIDEPQVLAKASSECAFAGAATATLTLVVHPCCSADSRLAGPAGW